MRVLYFEYLGRYTLYYKSGARVPVCPMNPHPCKTCTSRLGRPTYRVPWVPGRQVPRLGFSGGDTLAGPEPPLDGRGLSGECPRSPDARRPSGTAAAHPEVRRKNEGGFGPLTSGVVDCMYTHMYTGRYLGTHSMPSSPPRYLGGTSFGTTTDRLCRYLRISETR